MEAMVRLSGLRKRFRLPAGEVEVLAGIDLEVARGEVFGLIGPSGAGKSTLLRLINLLEPPTAGRVEVGGVELTGLSEARLRCERRRIGMVFQHFHLLWSRTVWGNVALPLEIAGWTRTEIRRRVDELIDLVGLSDRADAYPSQLSGGQRQRVGIARALAARPELLLCDEPTSALDTETTAQILALLRDVNRRFGLTIVLVTHELDVVRVLCDRVGVLERGRLADVGTVEQVLGRSRTPAARRHLEAEVAG